MAEIVLKIASPLLCTKTIGKISIPLMNRLTLEDKESSLTALRKTTRLRPCATPTTVDLRDLAAAASLSGRDGLPVIFVSS
ncbi:hypothetical protein SDRG_03878 [Saprolegnia diclina VS20]|uniref:Uncharacterized protein n=1 Tax=Saprolegnia diclina (strain VS20) TaxID=1156394 RepID=T0QY03_SAPDV|nr:hypothetical protein SDRG_03878 [Saprolegnia diclina VS20]XP_008621324.1 hypothetical protein SDRG_16878 [Saprolegnia diclina VS20]EQC25240.1 hypothetical protein SDRG_16878 [Saprolegnia diclina VS20]EQC38920.1 hypothetical protein SDRG_03878 [Saprolegnia diclina VS20]|eukprot:XP_008607744.1 hypothetical protein SDRG_03878 [Saprolegnia diclina VS20]